MADNRYRERYIYSSAAPKIYEEPVRVPRRPVREDDSQKQERRLEENRRQFNKVGALMACFITCALVVLFMTCIKYVAGYNRKQTNAGNMAKLQAEYEELREQNNLKKLAIDNSIDYNKIYNKAVGELGMVYADKDQIIEYKSGDSEYVMQFGKLPE